MSHDDSIQWQRYEAKYLITSMQAEYLLDYCRKHLPADPHSAVIPNRQYPIYSIYLDSPDWINLRDTVERKPMRVKLRIRTYRERHVSAQGLPAFFEVKRKVLGVIRKTRAKVSAELTAQVVQAGFPAFSHLPKDSKAARENLNTFLDVRRRSDAYPAVGVYYTREAYERRDRSGDTTRISLDRHLSYGLLDSPGSLTCSQWRPVPMQGFVILEVKFTNTFPEWVNQLIHRGEIVRTGFCKYLMCSRGVGQSGRSVFA